MDTLRIGTWNADHAKPSRNGGRLDVLRQFHADIWVLTETRDDLKPGDNYCPTHSAMQLGTRAERWVTIWSTLPSLGSVAVHDTSRTVAALYETPFGPLVVYGTVLPWHADRGAKGTAKSWTEQYRVVPIQAEEWASLASRHSPAALCVAGDLNLGGSHCYGTKLGRDLLERGLEGAGLVCVTRTERVPVGKVQACHIDHVCLSASWAERASVAEAWPATIHGVGLSDRSGILVAVRRPPMTKQTGVWRPLNSVV